MTNNYRTVTIPIDKIVVDDLRPQSKRRQQSLASAGNIQPIYVNAVNGHFELVDGRGRLADMLAIGATQIKAVVEKDMTPKRKEITGLALNLGRSDNPMNEAEMIESLLNMGMKVGEIAEAVGAKQPVVSQRKALLRLIPELRQALKSGAMPFTAGRYACKKFGQAIIFSRSVGKDEYVTLIKFRTGGGVSGVGFDVPRPALAAPPPQAELPPQAGTPQQPPPRATVGQPTAAPTEQPAKFLYEMRHKLQVDDREIKRRLKAAGVTGFPAATNEAAYAQLTALLTTGEVV